MLAGDEHRLLTEHRGDVTSDAVRDKRKRKRVLAGAHFSQRRPIAIPGSLRHMMRSGWCFAMVAQAILGVVNLLFCSCLSSQDLHANMGDNTSVAFVLDVRRPQEANGHWRNDCCLVTPQRFSAGKCSREALFTNKYPHDSYRQTRYWRL